MSASPSYGETVTGQLGGMSFDAVVGPLLMREPLDQLPQAVLQRDHRCVAEKLPGAADVRGAVPDVAHAIPPGDLGGDAQVEHVREPFRHLAHRERVPRSDVEGMSDGLL